MLRCVGRTCAAAVPAVVKPPTINSLSRWFVSVPLSAGRQPGHGAMTAWPCDAIRFVNRYTAGWISTMDVARNRRCRIKCMPLQCDLDIHASTPLRRLRSGQWRSMAPLLQRETGQRALRIGAADDDAPPTGMIWTRLWLAHDGYRGDLRGHADEPLPFIDDAFDLVWLQHALEPASQVAALLAEACRVLAPGGMLAVTAVHPLGGWAPWFCWHARGQRQSLPWPWQLRRYLRREGLEIESERRLGAYRPGAVAVADSRWGGGYLLLARKRRRIAIPVKLRPLLPARVPVNARLSPGTRRHSVS